MSHHEDQEEEEGGNSLDLMIKMMMFEVMMVLMVTMIKIIKSDKELMNINLMGSTDPALASLAGARVFA